MMHREAGAWALPMAGVFDVGLYFSMLAEMLALLHLELSPIEQPLFLVAQFMSNSRAVRTMSCC